MRNVYIYVKRAGRGRREGAEMGKEDPRKERKKKNCSKVSNVLAAVENEHSKKTIYLMLGRCKEQHKWYL